MSINFRQYVASVDGWTDRAKSSLDKSGNILAFAQYTAVATRSFYTKFPTPYANDIEKASGNLRSLISAILFLNTMKEIVTLRLFYETVTNKDGIETRKQRKYVEIASKVCFAFFRLLSASSLLHNTGVMDLGKHARQKLGNGMFFFLIAGIGISAVQKASNLLTPTTEGNSTGWLDLGSELLDLAALPIEFGFLMGGSPAVSLIGAGICLLSVGIHLARED